jgi:hypothetical protein
LNGRNRWLSSTVIADVVMRGIDDADAIQQILRHLAVREPTPEAMASADAVPRLLRVREMVGQRRLDQNYILVECIVAITASRN